MRARDERESARRLARWLGDNVVSPEGRGFLARLARLDNPAKATALSQASARAGLVDCPLADAWARAPRRPEA